MKKFIVGLLFSIMVMGTAHAHVTNFSHVEYVNAYDGDTIIVNIPGVPEIFGRLITVKLRAINAPEIKGRCADERYLAVRARNWIRSRLQAAQVIELHELERDKYFRIVADVKLDGEDLSIMMMERGYAVRHTEGPKPSPWCEVDRIDP